MGISRKLFLSALAALVALVVVVAPAGATVVHREIGSFTGADAPGGPFGFLLPSDAVDWSNGDVYVTESGAFSAFGGQNVVDKFNEAGEYAGVQLTGAKIIGQEAFAFGLFPGVAVDNSIGANKGDVYVADAGHHAVDRFSAAGAFLCQITGGTPVSKEEQEHECNGAAGSLTPDGSIEPSGIAVDTAGVIYVADDAHAVVDEFSETGGYLGQIKDPHISNEIGTIALDATGALYVTNLQLVGGTVDDVVKFDAAGSFVSIFDEYLSYGVGVDPKTGNVYIQQGGESHEGLAEYESSGALLSMTATAGPALGLAVDGASGKLYEAGLTTGSVSIFSGDVAIPTVNALPATNITETSATLWGRLDPDAAHGGGEVSECEFEWGTTTAYGNTAPCSPAGPYSGAAFVSAPIGGLTRGTTYHFRLKAGNANGESESADQTLAAAGAAVIDAQFSRVNGVSAELTAQINPYHFDTTCQAQYVDEASYQSSGYANATTVPCAPEDLGAGFGDVRGGVALAGLEIGTTYHYRFLAANQSGSTTGADRTFVTFGMHGVGFEIIDEAGRPFTQAGGHPYELRTAFSINWSENVGGQRLVGGDHPEEVPNGNLRNIINELPVGLVGDPAATPKCTRAEVIRYRCSGADQVGRITINEASGSGQGFDGGYRAGIYNVVPPRGVAAEFDANVEQHVTIHIDARLRSGGDYGVTAESTGNTALTGTSEVVVHFWGVPADPSHDAQRLCPDPSGFGEIGPCSAKAPELRPFLRDPTSCAGPLSTVLGVDSYQAPGLFDNHVLPLEATTGCDKPPFTPSIVAAPTTNATDSASGLSFDLHLPQPDGCKEEAAKVACEDGESDLKDTTVTFPAGLTVDPSSADGLAGCSQAQVGFTGFTELNKAGEPGVRTPQFTPLPAQCPDASKLGTVEVDTPLVDHPLIGSIYLARQGENPFGSLLAVYLTIYDPITGVVVKLPGEIKADPVTGQLTTTFDQNPQVPFEDFKIRLFEGPRAPLTTPATCGVFTTSSVLTPWSGSAAVSPASSFEVSASAGGGGSCPATAGQEPMAPSFSAGTYSPIAGTYSPLVLRVGREDGSQQLRSLDVTLPEGLLGRLAGVEECSQAQVEAAQRRSGLGEGRLEIEHPSCQAGSEIGVVHVGVGSGAPYYVTGHAYLAGPYQGAPFSVVVITPATAGPFDLGTVVVRSALSIDRSTAQVSVKSDPFPSILDGIPLEIRSISVQVTRPQFTLNPTSCEKMTVSARIVSTQGAQANVSSPFQVGGCNNLSFDPSFSASTHGKNSRLGGASLSVRVAQKTGEANIHGVDLQLPVQLPSRLSTLKLACTAAQFEADPAGCPAASQVGSGTATTPLLSVPLSGPAYLVSHGGAEFPDIEFVLQGVEQGGTIEIVLDGKTQIKNGLTYSHFQTVPDAPIGSFETVFPQGPHSILATNVPGNARYSLCGQKLTMPTTLTAQNGLVFRQNTTIAVSGCPKVKHLSRHSQLLKALRACRHTYKHAGEHARRRVCERTARRRYAAKSKRKK